MEYESRLNGNFSLWPETVFISSVFFFSLFLFCLSNKCRLINVFLYFQCYYSLRHHLSFALSLLLLSLSSVARSLAQSVSSCTNTLNKKDALAFFEILPLSIFLKQKTIRDSESSSKDGAFAKNRRFLALFVWKLCMEEEKTPEWSDMHF